MTADTTSTEQLVAEFRANGGKISGPFSNARALLLTTTDVRTGERVTTPVAYLHDNGKRSIVVAVPDESGRLPAWYDDVCAEPMVELETGTFDLRSRAEVLTGDERDELFDRFAETDPTLVAARRRLGAPLPLIALHPVSGRPAAGTGWGNDLKVLHDGYRRELALVRQEVATGGRRLAAQLKINCLRMCAALNHHHGQEDIQLLPVVAEKHPELAGVVAELREQHEAMAVLLEELRQVVSDENVSPAEILPMVERITADVEAHLDYEEQLIPVLNALVPGD